MNKFWDYKSLDQLHIELTNACNAACPMCVRFHKASPLIRPDLTIGQITLEKFKQWIPPEVLKQIMIILFWVYMEILCNETFRNFPHI